MQDMGRKFAFQAVHSMFGGGKIEEWKEDERRISRMVFIGKDLPREEIEKAAMACVANTVPTQKERQERLKFMFGSGHKFKA